MSYQLRKLRTTSELALFAEGFGQTLRRRTAGKLSGHVPLEYLQRCQSVRGLFDDEGRMVAGYAVGAAPPYRLLDFVPESAREALPAPAGARWEDCCELTCVWRDPSVPSAIMGRRVWPFAALDVLLSRRTYILGGDQSARLDAKYSRLMGHSQTLYAGLSTFGMDSRLFAFNRWGALRGALWAALVDPLARWFQKRAAPKARALPVSAPPRASREHSLV